MVRKRVDTKLEVSEEYVRVDSCMPWLVQKIWGRWKLKSVCISVDFTTLKKRKLVREKQGTNYFKEKAVLNTEMIEK